MHFNHPNSRKDGSDEYSDFPPIRERKSSPDPPIASVTSLSCHHSLAVQRFEPRSSSEVRSPPRNKGLGQKNILNAIWVKVCVKTQSFQTLSYWTLVCQTRRAPKSSSKRGLEVEVADEHPRKRQHCTLEVDMDWLKGEFADIRSHIMEIGEQGDYWFIYIIHWSWFETLFCSFCSLERFTHTGTSSIPISRHRPCIIHWTRPSGMSWTRPKVLCCGSYRTTLHWVTYHRFPFQSLRLPALFQQWRNHL